MVEEGIGTVWLPAFKAMVQSNGPEAAFRQLQKMAGEGAALETRKTWEKLVGIITEQAGPSTLKKSGLSNWYSGPSEDDRFWPALKRYLREGKGWAPSAIEAIDNESTGVMRLLPYPGGAVNVKGLVVGYVQSGKTANYTALIAKAADVGYRLIIVLAGIHNGLRRQTQERLQAELVDVDGKLKSEWHTLTQAKEDFRERGTNTDAFLAEHNHQRILLVVKKNIHVLGRLVKWLNAAQPRLREQCPALIIDDEADQAGLNTGKNQRSAINARILQLKAALPKSAYVGYTATPFANVLVDPRGDDLYPEDFIVALNKPEGYFGTELFFGRDALEDDDPEPVLPPDMFREVEVDEIPLLRPMKTREVATFTPGMPESLATAIRYFLLATAARWVRGHRKKHSSMLVHTALNPSIHKLLAENVSKELSKLKRGLKTAKLHRELEALWADEHSRVRVQGLEAVAFDQVWNELPDVLSKTKVVEDNGQSDSRLIYKEELHLSEDDKVAHIAVGGNTLSRGLTLEGLMVSYFVRSSNAYDTLLQMGRWFGYRFGYQDLPRLWMTKELHCAFHDLATVEEEIRRDIARYDEEGLTPKQFAVRIRTHPTIAVTSRLKMQYAVKGRINYSGATRQTTKFYLDDAWLRSNWAAGGALLDSLRTAKGQSVQRKPRYTYFEHVPETLVRQFIGSYQFHEGHDDLQPHLLERYIDAQLKRGRCSVWTVCVASLAKPSPELGSAHLGKLGEPFNLINRSKKERPVPDGSVDLGTMTTQSDFEIGLSVPLARKVARSGSKAQLTRPADSEPLLLLYPISKDSRGTNPTNNKGPTGATTEILGVAVAFPNTSPDETDGPLSEHDYIHVALPAFEAYVEEEEAHPDEDDG